MSFKYIDPDNVGYTAGDADILSDLDFEELLPGNEKVLFLRIGNTGSTTADYTITGTSVNSGILPSFQISDDGENYGSITSGIVISSLEPNQISDKVYIKFTVPDDAYISDGTIRLYTVES